MISKDLIHYFVRKTINELPSKWQEKLKGVQVFVYDNHLRFNPEKKKSEIMGGWHKKTKTIIYYLSSILNNVAGDSDIYKILRKVESVVEHELLHAVGLNHKQINEYRKSKEIDS